jgi:hypothetical protein
MIKAHPMEGLGRLKGCLAALEPVVSSEEEPAIDEECRAHKKKSLGFGHPAILQGALTAKGEIIVIRVSSPMILASDDRVFKYRQNHA